MPTRDEDAKAWQEDQAGRFGAQVKRWRTSMGLSAVKLSTRTAELGFPVTSVAISKIESNSRAGKVDLAELLVLARALGVAPLQLVFSELPDGKVQMLPHEERRSIEALTWAAGEYSLPSQWPTNDLDMLYDARQYYLFRMEAEKSSPTHRGMAGVAQRAVISPARRLKEQGHPIDFVFEDDEAPENDSDA